MRPMAVVRSGQRHSSAGTPSDARCSTSSWHCVLLPALSAPSNTMKAPRPLAAAEAAAGAMMERRARAAGAGLARPAASGAAAPMLSVPTGMVRRQPWAAARKEAVTVGRTSRCGAHMAVPRRRAGTAAATIPRDRQTPKVIPRHNSLAGAVYAPTHSAYKGSGQWTPGSRQLAAGRSPRAPLQASPQGGAAEPAHLSRLPLGGPRP